MTYYEILAVSPNATESEIRQAFRARAHTCHSDHGGTDDRMREVIEAFEILRDPATRREYDESLTPEAAPVVVKAAEKSVNGGRKVQQVPVEK